MIPTCKIVRSDLKLNSGTVIHLIKELRVKV